MAKVKPVPDGYHTATPYLSVRGGENAIAFYKKAFGAEERMRMPGPGGTIMHAEIKIGDSVVMLADENPEMGTRSPSSLNGTTGSILLYLNDVDVAFGRAIAAGAKELMAPQDLFWGDRMGKLADPFGHEWALATHTEDVAPEEMARRARAMSGQ